MQNVLEHGSGTSPESGPPEQDDGALETDQARRFSLQSSFAAEIADI